jgi:3',5'-cyclic AMP phosphodiesterase CpdA
VTVRIAHVSDIHFGGEHPAATEAAIQSVKDFAPNLTVVTGDLTLNGLPREFAAARAWLARLPAPVLVTPGNHDTPYWNLPLRALVPFRRYRHYIGEPGAEAFDGTDFVARCVNSARGAQPRLNWSKGAIAIPTLQSIDWGRPGALKVFACHHPLIEIAGSPVTGGVRRGERAAAVLAAADVDLILTGHVHVPFALALPGVTSPCYALGAGTLSLRTRGTPQSFSTILADSTAFEVTALSWNDRGFEPLQVWNLPRRSPTPPAMEGVISQPV